MNPSPVERTRRLAPDLPDPCRMASEGTSLEPKLHEPEGEDRQRPDGAAPWPRPRRVLLATNSWLGRLSAASATAILTLGAVAAALAAHLLIGWLLFGGVSAETLISASIVTLVVATPVIALAVTLLRRIAGSRRALKAMTERLALALDGAEQANRAKSRFLANMSHELRTPLNAVIGFSEVMRDEMLGPMGSDRYREYARDINDSGRHLLGIINGILDLAKIEAGGVETEAESEFDLSEQVTAALRMVQPMADKQGVALHSTLPATAVRALAVERMLRQVVLNVLSNAIKFTPAGGTVDLTLTRNPGGDVVVAVADTGIGMTADEIRIAMMPFGQARNAMTASQAGTGLGLPLARAMIEMHGGRLKIASQPGEGTLVELTLPAARVRAAAEAVQERAVVVS